MSCTGHLPGSSASARMASGRDEPPAVATALAVFVVAAAMHGGGAADRFPDAELDKDRMDGVASPAVCRYP